MDFIEVSARDNINIREAFSKMSMDILDKVVRNEIKVDELVRKILDF